MSDVVDNDMHPHSDHSSPTASPTSAASDVFEADTGMDPPSSMMLDSAVAPNDFDILEAVYVSGTPSPSPRAVRMRVDALIQQGQPVQVAPAIVAPTLNFPAPPPAPAHTLIPFALPAVTPPGLSADAQGAVPPVSQADVGAVVVSTIVDAAAVLSPTPEAAPAEALIPTTTAPGVDRDVVRYHGVPLTDRDAASLRGPPVSGLLAPLNNAVSSGPESMAEHVNPVERRAALLQAHAVMSQQRRHLAQLQAWLAHEDTVLAAHQLYVAQLLAHTCDDGERGF
ncbi:hypothetical protein C8Q76DRAFT_792169 [Earliella scabrosa]|nr:hypothetical protein C8Q76DRAFT_792169 [Earliella scabrosa]